ncbi:MAG: hypothetical protein Q8N92_07890, partial [Erysipelotrichaceae bacterium]|nr:hypothetical protein [Erysipelotrichaceae bacterium]
KVIERINNSLKTTHLIIDNTEIELSSSVGLCELADEINPEDMIAKADKLMYESKNRKQVSN